MTCNGNIVNAIFLELNILILNLKVERNSEISDFCSMMQGCSVDDTSSRMLDTI